MIKIYLSTFFLFSQISLASAQTNLVNWSGSNNTSTASYPRSGSGLSSELTSAAENFNSLSSFADTRNIWNNLSTSATVDPNTSPYLSYALTTNSNIDFDRFVLGGAAAVSGAVKLQLRWSVDNYASSLGDFAPLDSAYHLFSVDLSSTSTVLAGTAEFRVYFYNSAGYIFNPGYYSYTSLDGTPASYGGNAQAISIWGSQSVLSTDDIEGSRADVKAYPNPSSDFIKVSGINTSEKYSIYNALGTIVKEGSVINKEEINIKNLINGLYFIHLESGSTIKFMKE